MDIIYLINRISGWQYIVGLENIMNKSIKIVVWVISINIGASVLEYITHEPHITNVILLLLIGISMHLKVYE